MYVAQRRCKNKRSFGHIYSYPWSVVLRFRGSVVPWCSAFVCLFVCRWYIWSVSLFVSGMYVDLDLVATARLCRVSHKMRITTEDGDFWVNKACKSGRIATAIKDNNNSMLYMYIGGGAVAVSYTHLRAHET